MFLVSMVRGLEPRRGLAIGKYLRIQHTGLINQLKSRSANLFYSIVNNRDSLSLLSHKSLQFLWLIGGSLKKRIHGTLYRVPLIIPDNHGKLN